MAIILNIDTAISNASLCLADDETALAFMENTEKKEHAAWLHKAIKEMLHTGGMKLSDIEAIAVSNGPGSYTGLRIGLSTAKGLCYTLKIPLLCVNTLTIMASAVKDVAEELICPLIDARRMEVFTALYDKNLHIIAEAEAKVLATESFSDILRRNKVVFTGDGMSKFKNLTISPNAYFFDHNTNAINMLELSFRQFQNGRFADLAYAEPFYVKAVYTK